MDKKMEIIISNDLGISVEKIRDSSWEDLEKMPKKKNEKAFKSQDMFFIDRDIHLSLGREIGMLTITINEVIRKLAYIFKKLITKWQKHSYF